MASILKKICINVGISSSALNNLFNKYFQQSPIDYVISKRMKLAKKMLRFRKENIETIAIELGYKYPSYFSNLFKKIYGISPSEYQAKYM